MANKFIKGLTEKLTMLVDDWFVIQPDAEEGIAYKIKRSNVPTNLENGSGTTANGNAVDLGGIQAGDVIIKKADSDTFKIIRADDTGGDWQEFNLNSVLSEWHQLSTSGGWLASLELGKDFFQNFIGGISIFGRNEPVTKLAGISCLADGTIMVGDLSNGSGRFSKMFFKHDYTSLWDALSAGERARIIPDFGYVSENFLSKTNAAPSIAATILDIDFNNREQYKTTAEVAATADFSITLSNTTNAQIATIDLFITNTVIITFPAGSILDRTDTRVTGALEATIPGATGSSIELSLNKVGSKYKWVISPIFS